MQNVCEEIENHVITKQALHKYWQWIVRYNIDFIENFTRPPHLSTIYFIWAQAAQHTTTAEDATRRQTDSTRYK